jgi:large subunit ribosomal protein L23
MDYIIRKPIITERSFADAQSGIFTFLVGPKAIKIEIKKAIEELFKVHVKSIATSMIKGKKRLVGKRRLPVYETDLKKVRVTLAKGEKIDLFEVGEKK